MKHHLTVVLLLFCSFCYCQLEFNSTLPPIDTSAFSKWPSLTGNPVISNDGGYVAFAIKNQPLGRITLIIKVANGSLLKQVVVNDFDNDNIFFTSDSKQLIWKSGDTLFLYSLKIGNLKIVPDISSAMTPLLNKGKWIAYQLKTNKEVILLNVLTGSEKRFEKITYYNFDYHGNSLFIKQQNKKIDELSEVLVWIRLEDGTSTTMWRSEDRSGEKIGNISTDTDGKQICFVVQNQKKAKSSNSLWYAKVGDSVATLIASELPLKDKSYITVNAVPRFSRSGKWIFFLLQCVYEASETKSQNPDMLLWSYKDSVLQPEQLRRLKRPVFFTAVVPSGGGQVIQLEQKDDFMCVVPQDVTSDYIVLMDKSNLPYWWPHSEPPSYYLVSLKDGKRTFLKSGIYSLNAFSFSPNGNYLIYWDSKEKNFFSLDVVSGKTHNISKKIPVLLTNEIQRNPFPSPVSSEPAGWIEKENAVLLYGNYDIWQVDLSGKTQAINITGGYGAKHRIKFRMVDEESGYYNKKVLYKGRDTIFLTGFDINNKFNGFFVKTLRENKPPKELVFGPYTYYLTMTQMGGPFYKFDAGIPPVKARNFNAWVIERSSATEAPNYFYTENFKCFVSLSDLSPQKKYNWLTTELITWKTFDGSSSQGILYKPENFDPKKKYPIIFNYYERLSHRLYEFPIPWYTISNINIPWFVSNGYLVFTPDIHYKVAAVSGKTAGEWAYNSVVSAAKYLSKLSFVDKKRMALQGHSFGGFETAYLVTHCNLFTAASEVAGSTDPTSRYLTLAPLSASFEHSSTQESIEMGHEQYGVSLWQEPELYLKNSAVLNANRVTTPLLIVHNPKDNQVQWRQGVELYMALRRLGKKCWMLQYDGSGHSLSGNDAIDYTIRLTQFFDYYLKGAPPPEWMTEGVSVISK